MASSSRRNTTLEFSLADSYRLAWNRLYFDDFQREAEFLTSTYSKLLDISIDALLHYARNGHWQVETQIVTITRQAQCSHNLLVVSLCLADSAALLKRRGRDADARQIDQIAEGFYDISYDFKRDGL
jgi:hypothetical protein